MLIARIMEDGGVGRECMAGSGQVYEPSLNSFSYSCQLQSLLGSTQTTVQQNLQALSKKRWGKVMEKRAGRNHMTTCAKEWKREVRFKGSKNVKTEGSVSADTEQAMSLFPDGRGASRHCLTEWGWMCSLPSPSSFQEAVLWKCCTLFRAVGSRFLEEKLVTLHCKKLQLLAPAAGTQSGCTSGGFTGWQWCMDALQRDKWEYNQEPQMSVVHCGDSHHSHPSNDADWGCLM